MTPFYPQLSNGCLAQLPFRYERRIYAPGLDLVNGGVAIGASTQWEHTWDLQYHGLSQSEADALEEFFRGRRGRLLPFGFVTPAGNLLSCSEELFETAWIKEPLLGLQAGASDPGGGTAATLLTNAGQSSQSVWQAVAAPGTYWYSFRVLLRSTSAGEALLWRRAGANQQSEAVAVGPEWRAFEVSGRFEQDERPVRFGLTLEPGQSVAAFGFQVEAQPFSGEYTRTPGAGGVFTNARFDNDALEITAEGPDAFRAAVRIVCIEERD